MAYFVFIKRILNTYVSRSEYKYFVIGIFLVKFENLLTEYKNKEDPQQHLDLDRYIMASVQHITLGEMDADHKEPWAKGGETTLDNARCLCVSCNRSRKAA